MKEEAKTQNKIWSKHKALKGLAIAVAAELLLLAAVVFVLDPFYQYHAPWLGLQQTLFDRETQMAGSIRNLSYDSVLLGSSMVENCDSTYLDARYNCHTLKIIKASGSAADLLYYLELAHNEQELTYIFWGLDLSALTASNAVTLPDVYSPSYLFTEMPLDDLPYLFNKDVLLEKIPLMLAYSYTGINTGGAAYDWSDGKDFSAAKAMEDYQKPEEPLPEQPIADKIPVIEENIRMVLEEINTHPETHYRIFFPPYSMMMWDYRYTSGTAEELFYALEQVLPALLACENVEVYYFQSDVDIICNLDNYMDKNHYSPAINQYMLECMAAGEYRVTEENMDEVLSGMREVYEYIITEGIYKYYD